MRLRSAPSGSEQPRAVVLLYHRVADAADIWPDPPGQAVSPAVFERHLRLVRARYHVASLPDLVEGLARGDYRDRTIAVSFDDGYRDNFTVAAPIAAELDVPLTLFATVRPLLERTVFWWDELAARLQGRSRRRGGYRKLHGRLRRLTPEERGRELAELGDPTEVDRRSALLTDQELQAFAALPGATVGAHTLTHPVLAALPASEQLHELSESRRLLEELLGRSVDLLAYPFGKPADLGERAPSLAASVGYRAAFTSAAGRIVPSSPSFELPRLSVHDWGDRELGRRLGACFG